MSEIPQHLKYAKTHEWIRIEKDNTATIGITDHAQHLLGDLVFVELPEVGQMVDAGEECAVVESVKAASDVYSPIAGKVIQVNAALEDEPELVNSSPYDDGWLFKLQPSDTVDLKNLLTADQYAEALTNEE